MPNIARLTKLAEFVESLPPERLNMNCYFSQDFDVHDCNTTACLAGWAALAFPESLVNVERGVRFRDRPSEKRPTSDIVGEFFELTGPQFLAIFDCDIPNGFALPNLWQCIERWSKAQPEEQS